MLVTYQIISATISIIFLIFYYYAIGFLLNPFVFSNNKNQDIRINENIFLGLISNVLFLYFWNLFFPIGGKAILIFLLLCILIGIKSGVFKKIKNIFREIRLTFILFIFLISIWLGFLSNNNIGPYDFGLYHLQIIKWAENFHIIKGIGNLHHRLGFSCNGWFLTSQFNTALDTKLFYWTHGSIYLIIGFINFLYIPLFLKNHIKTSEKIVRVLYLPVLFYYCFTGFPGTSSDLPVFLFTSIISIYYFRLIINKNYYSLNMILIASVLGITSKLSFGAVIMGLAVPLILIISKKFSIRKYLIPSVLTISLTTFTLWSCRNIIMTGFPFYPYSKISLPVSWKMDKQNVERAKKDIRNAATSSTNLKSLNYNERLKWYHNKITAVQHRKIEIYYPIIIGIFGILFSWFYLKEQLWKIMILTFPSFFPMFLWTEFPVGRFFSSYFWWFGIMLIVFPLTKIIKKRYHYNWFCLLIILISISNHVFDRLGSPKEFFPIYNRTKIPDVVTKKIKNGQGLTYFKPENDDRCWDSDLPCSPEKFWIRNVVQTNAVSIKEGYKLKK